MQPVRDEIDCCGCVFGSNVASWDSPVHVHALLLFVQRSRDACILLTVEMVFCPKEESIRYPFAPLR